MVLVLIASQNMGPWLKVLSDRLRWQREGLLCSLTVLDFVLVPVKGI